jgi:nucleolar complex protein 2
VIVGAESSTFSRRLSEVQKQQDEQDSDEQDSDEGTIAFSKNWFAENKKPKYVLPSLFFPLLLAVENTLSYHCSVCRTPKENKKRPREDDDVATEEDRVEDLVLSSDEEDGNNQEPEDGFVPVEGDSDEDFVDPDSEYKKQKKAKLKKRNKRQPLSHKAPSRTKRNSHPKKKTRH